MAKSSWNKIIVSWVVVVVVVVVVSSSSSSPSSAAMRSALWRCSARRNQSWLFFAPYIFEGLNFCVKFLAWKNFTTFLVSKFLEHLFVRGWIMMDRTASEARTVAGASPLRAILVPAFHISTRSVFARLHECLFRTKWLLVTLPLF